MGVFVLTEAAWEISKDLITNGPTVESEIYKILGLNENVYLRLEDYKIVLPKTVNVAQRHKIHKLSRPGFYSRSKGEFPNRTMEIFIEPDYVEYLNRVFYRPEPVDPEPEPEPEPETPIQAFKKAILEDIMLVVEKHLNDVFLKYYN
jgi:hypothetical protein